ncbi:hypothetical protein NMG60_11027609 [Bertholletia excelsa]
MYCLIVQKFIGKGISMIPKVAAELDPTGRMDFWPNQEQKLESVHSPEAFDMIQSHLSLVLGDRVVGPLNSIMQISKFNLGNLYAASIIYGYFLRCVDQRFQLERSMNTLPKNFMSEEHVKLGEPSPLNQHWGPASVIPPDNSDGRGLADSGKSYQLRSYVMCLDADTLQKYATIRSPEAISLIEKQTLALFGSPDIRNSEDASLDTSDGDITSLTFSGLKMLVLEAVAFGSFLWDAEGYVESKYHFINS